MIWRLVVTCAFLCWIGCGHAGKKGKDDKPGIKNASTYAGLAFATVDRGYTSSSLWFNDFNTGKITNLATGESSDPWLTELNGTLYLFNRTATRLNFRTLDWQQGTLGTELASPEAVAGDPHAALALDSHRILLAQSGAGKLVVVDPATGTATQTIGSDAGFDTGSGPFRPEAFYQRTVNGEHEVYVLHQGLGADFQTGTGKSQLFLLKDDGTTLTAVDTDSGKDGIQGISLQTTDPVALLENGDQLYAVGLCPSWIKGDCTGAAEQIDLTARSAKIDFDFKESGWLANGGIVNGPGASFYAAVTKSSTEKSIVNVTLDTGTITVAHKFPETSAGCCALYYDEQADALYVGDFAADGSEKGIITYYPHAQASTTLSVDGGPYSGWFVSK